MAVLPATVAACLALIQLTLNPSRAPSALMPLYFAVLCGYLAAAVYADGLGCSALRERASMMAAAPSVGQRLTGRRAMAPVLTPVQRRADRRLRSVLHAVVVMRSLLEQHLCVVLPALIKLVRGGAWSRLCSLCTAVLYS